MAKETVGLKIGASYLSAAAIEVNGSARLVQVAREPIPRGIVAGGEVKDVDALTEALKFFFKRHGLSKRNVRIGIANNRIGVRTIELTGIDDPKQVANAVRFRAQEALPIPVDQALLDYQVLGETVEEGQSKKRVLLVVAYRELVDAYSTRVPRRRHPAGRRRPRGLRAPARADAVRRSRSGEKSALVAVTIGSERSTLGVSDGTVLRVRSRDRVGRNVSDDRPLAGARPGHRSRRAPQDEHLARRRRDPRGAHARAGRPRPRGAQRCAPGLLAASSSPRFSSTRASPTRSASARSSSPAAPRALPASHRRFSASSA